MCKAFVMNIYILPVCKTGHPGVLFIIKLHDNCFNFILNDNFWVHHKFQSCWSSIAYVLVNTR